MVINALRSDLVERAATEPGYALNVAYNHKWRMYGELCEQEWLAFVPIPFDTLGALHPTSIHQLTKLAKALARSNGSEEEECIRHMFQRVSIQLTKSNVSMILNRVQSTIDPSIDGLM